MLLCSHYRLRVYRGYHHLLSMCKKTHTTITHVIHVDRIHHRYHTVDTEPPDLLSLSVDFADVAVTLLCNNIRPLAYL